MAQFIFHLLNMERLAMARIKARTALFQQSSFFVMCSAALFQRPYKQGSLDVGIENSTSPDVHVPHSFRHAATVVFAT